jgi:hypothetical protein
MRPIHKYDNSNGSTLCRNCRVVITRDLTDALYCDKCKGYDNQKIPADKEKK